MKGLPGGTESDKATDLYFFHRLISMLLRTMHAINKKEEDPPINLGAGLWRAWQGWVRQTWHMVDPIATACFF